MALLAIIDVEDPASPKIKNVKGAMEDLVATTVKAAQTVKDASVSAAAVQVASLQAVQQAIQQQSVASQQAAQAQAAAAAQQAAQAAAAAQAQAMAVTQAAGAAAAEASQRIQQLTAQQLAQAQAASQAAAATVQATAAQQAHTVATQAEVQALEQQHRLVLQQAGAYATLHKQLQAGATVTDAQAKLFKTLSDAVIYSKGASLELSAEMAKLQQAIQGGAKITPELAKRLQEAGQAAGFLAPTLKQVGTEADNANKGMERAIGGSAKLAAGLAAATAGLYAFLRGSVDLAARVETLGVVTEIIARNTGQSTIVMLAQVESMKKLGITTKESYDSVIKLSQAQIDLANASKLARAAQDLAVVANENSSETLQRLIRYIQSGNSELIKNLGIIASQDSIYRQYAATVGKAVSQLDQFDKKQANLNFVLQEAVKFTGTYERSLDTAGKQMASLARYVEESRLALGEGLMPIFGALIQLTTEFLKWWLQLPDSIQNVVASAGLMITVMTTLLSVMAIGKWIGIADGIGTLVTAFTAARVAGAGFGAAMVATLGPVGLALTALAVTIGVVAGAWNYLAAETRMSTDDLQKAGAAAQSTIERIESQKAVIEQLGPVTNRTAQENERFAYAIAEITRLVPGAAAGVAELGGSYARLSELAKKAVDDQYALLLTLRNAAKTQAEQAAATRQALDKQLSGSVARIEQLDKEIAAVKAGNVVLRDRQQVDDFGRVSTYQTAASLEELTKARKREADTMATISKDRAAIFTKENEFLQEQFGLESTLPQFAADVRKRASAEIRRELDLDMQKYDNLAERARIAGMSIGKLADSKSLMEYRERLSEINTAWMAHLKKVEADAKKYASAFDAMLDKIRGTATATQAQFSAVNRGLGEVTRGSDEYNRRIVMAADIIKQVGRAPDSAVAGLKNLRQAFEDLEQRDFERWAEGVITSLDKMGLAANEAFENVTAQFGGDVTSIFRELADAEYDLRRDSADKIEDLDRQIFEQRVLSRKDAVDREIYLERQRIEDLQKGIDREIEARERAHRKEVDLFEDKIRRAKEETREIARNIQTQIDLRLGQVRLEIEAQRQEGKITEEQAAARREAVEQLRVAEQARIEEMKRSRLEEIELEARTGRERLEKQKQLNDQIAASQQAAMARQRQASAENIRDIRRDYDLLIQIAKGAAQQMASSIATGFGDIIRQARSAKDVFVGIIQSMADRVLQIIEDMVAGWIERAARMALDPQSNGGSGGFNIGTFFRNLLGGGGGGAGATGSIAFTQAGGNGTLPSTQIGGFAPPIQLGGGGQSLGGWRLGGGNLSTGARLAGGAFLGGTVGGLVADRYADGSYAKGMLSGAASGAAAGGAYGGWWGAAAGGAAGLITGWLAARKQREQMKEDRQAIIDAAGGLNKFRREAALAGNDVDRLLETDSVKTFQRELGQLNAQVAKLDVDRFLRGADGIDKLKERAAAAGTVVGPALERLQNQTLTQEQFRGLSKQDREYYLERIAKLAEEARDEMERLNEAFELQDAKDAIAPTLTAMDDLRQRAVLVGYDLRKLYEAETIEEFNQEQEKLNKLLEKQQQRLNGLAVAAQGVDLMVEGMIGRLGRAFEEAFPGEREIEDLMDRYQRAVRDGFSGSMRDFLQNANQLPEGLAKTLARTQAEFTRTSGVLSAIFGRTLRETGDIQQAFNAIAGPLEKLATLQQELGLETNTTFRYLNQFRLTIRDNEDVAASLSGITMVLRGMTDSGGLTQTMFNDMGASAAEMWQTMEERGVAADQALLLMQPTLQALWQAQKNFGFETDATTQSLINMGIEQGLVGDQFQDVNSKILDMLVIIAEVLGADIPEAYRRQQTAAEEAANAAQNGATNTREAVEDSRDALRDALDNWENYAHAIETGIDTRGIDVVRDSLDGVTDGARIARDAIWDWAADTEAAAGKASAAVDGVSLGHSPGGLKEIPIKSREATAAVRLMSDATVADARRMEDAIRNYADRIRLEEEILRTQYNDAPSNVYVRPTYAGSTGNDEPAPAAEQAPAQPSVVIEQLVVQPITVQVNALDSANMEEAMRDRIAPALVAQMASNTDQITIQVGDAINRYFGIRGAGNAR